MPMLLATTNPHKMAEVRAILGDRVALVSLDDLGLASLPEPIEDGDTFEANALLKARYYAEAAGQACLADDSGLAVEALGGEPGVRSARYSGASGPRGEVDLANNAKLLDALGDTPVNQRTARFVCVMALCQPGGGEPLALGRGTMAGRILMASEAADPDHPQRGRGAHGFGYDPLFVVAGADERTSAELTPAQKNALSHRGDATRKLRAALIEAGEG